MMELLNSQLLAVLVAAGLLFGNELLVQHLLVTQLVAIKRLGPLIPIVWVPMMWKFPAKPWVFDGFDGGIHGLVACDGI